MNLKSIPLLLLPVSVLLLGACTGEAKTVVAPIDSPASPVRTLASVIHNTAVAVEVDQRESGI